ncbi:brain-specific angiogenesis inhibitor 1-associated protein 2 [Ixodes scapularis]|uniref:brain-specific angiogenesis inhibitor 1-associated protein 2 n=1 Tax=Ixodes scapularis TaxID=6945 RepID=UPI001A9F898D|nr:brain-specific angiogenesis inhibitor 1-associated protein 2 [Ixodes scapularis]
MQLVDVQKEIETQQMNILKAFYVDLIVPLESNIEKDAKVVASEQKRFLQQNKTHQEAYLKVASVIKKQRKKNRSSRGGNVDKEIKQMQALEEEKGKLDGFCESSLKQAITQERRRFGFVLERQCSLVKHYLAYTAKGHALLQHNVEGWLDIVRTRETLPESIGKIFRDVPEFRLPVHSSSEYACSGILSDPESSTSSLRQSTSLYGGVLGSNLLRKTRSTDASCLDLRSLSGGVETTAFIRPISRAKSDFNLASSTASLDSGEYVNPTRTKGSLSPELGPADRPRVRALYSYLSSGEHQLSFHEGDVIVLVGSRNGGWQYGVNLRNNRCGWFPIAYTEPHDFGDISDFESFISGSDSSPAVPSSSSESSGGSTGVSHRWRPQSFGASQDVAFRVGLPSAPAPRRPLSSFADTYLFRQPPSPFHLRLDTGGPAESAAQPHHRGLQPRPSSATLQPATALYGPANPTAAASATEPAGRFGAGGPAATTVAAGTPTSTDHHLRPAGSSSAASTPASGAAPATIHPLHHHLPGGVALRPPRRSMTSPFPFPMLPPRLPPSTSLHSSSDSGFCNDSSGQGSSTGGGGGGDKVTPSCSSSAEEVEEEKAEGEVERSKEEEEEEEREKAEAAEEAEDVVEEELRENAFSSVKLKKVLTNDRSAPMIT